MLFLMGRMWRFESEKAHFVSITIGMNTESRLLLISVESFFIM